ncbi:hypothetical protein EJB05_25524 [Eragrostis curvula]|uniref:CCT domain-containing protein n=1 Tax=Eragrostis curvula TaxID=38414 RepID=A0A5J9VE20_9POAL|nr:hypothetical protein EJB05_25524 [Eragrostis curvula]
MDDAAACSYCGAQRALLYCAQHAARLCLPCDVTVHAGEPAHERAPLCDGCHAAPAAARCRHHLAALCAPCAASARCVAEQHCQRPALTYTGFPEPDDLARILSGGGNSPPLIPPADTWVPDLVNIELAAGSSTWNAAGNDMVTSELPSDRFIKRDDGDSNFKTEITETATAPAAGLLMADDDELLMQQDWPNLDDFDFAAQAGSNTVVNPIGHMEGAFEASSSLGYDHTLLSSCSETILPSDAVLQSLTSNNAACQFSSVSANTIGSNVIATELPPHHVTFDMPVLPSDEFPAGLFNAGMPPGPPPVYQDQEPSVPSEKSGQDMEARMKQREKRQQAKQRYNDKKKNRRFGKQIMYESRKARADTRNRVKGRFAKSSSNSDQI